jgi:uncharacterized protein YkwD
LVVSIKPPMLPAMVVGALALSFAVLPARHSSPATEPALTASILPPPRHVDHAARDLARSPEPKGDTAPDKSAPAQAAAVSRPPTAARRAASVAAPAPVSTQLALINGDRAAVGLAPLSPSACLTTIAFQNAQRMAAQGSISHADGVYRDLGCGLGRQSGENVAYWSGGVNDVQANNLFMTSPDHRANVMGPYRYVGIAWVVAANGTGYIAEEFS